MNKILSKIILGFAIISVILITPFLSSDDKLSRIMAENAIIVNHNNGQGKNAISSDSKLFCMPDEYKHLNLVSVEDGFYGDGIDSSGFTINNKYDNSLIIDMPEIVGEDSEDILNDLYDLTEFYWYNNYNRNYLNFTCSKKRIDYNNKYIWFLMTSNIAYFIDNYGANYTPYYEFINNHRNYTVFNIYNAGHDESFDLFFYFYRDSFYRIYSYFSQLYQQFKRFNEQEFYHDLEPHSYEFYLSFNYDIDTVNGKIILSYLNVSIITPTYTLPLHSFIDRTLITEIKKIMYPISSILYYECYYTWFENNLFYERQFSNVINQDILIFNYSLYYEYTTLEFLINIDSRQILELNQGFQFVNYKKTNDNKKIVTYLLFNEDSNSYLPSYYYQNGYSCNKFEFDYEYVYNSFETKFNCYDSISNYIYKKNYNDVITGAHMSSGFFVNNATFSKSLADTCGFNSSYYISMPSVIYSKHKLLDFEFYKYNEADIKLYNHYSHYIFGNYMSSDNNNVSMPNVFSNFNDLYNKYTYLSSDVFTLGFKTEYNYNNLSLTSLQMSQLEPYFNESFLHGDSMFCYNFSYGLLDKNNVYYNTFINTNNIIIGQNFYNLLISDGDISINGNNNIVGGDLQYLNPIHQITLSINPSIANLGLSSGGYSQSYNNGELEYVESSGIWDWNANLSNAFTWIINNIPFMKELRQGVMSLKEYIEITFDLADGLKTLFPSIIISTIAICILCSFLKKSLDK